MMKWFVEKKGNIVIHIDVIEISGVAQLSYTQASKNTSGSR